MKKIIVVLIVFLLSISLSACKKNYVIPDDATTIKVAASPTPHAEILEQCVPLMAAKGYTLEIKEFSDYIMPNTATEEGSVWANYFQHAPFLEKFNQEKQTHLVSVGKIHYEPFGIYAGTSSSLSNLPSGSKIIVPNDGTNEARALLLLEQVGLITLKNGVDLTATKLDIADDNGYEIIEACEAQSHFDLLAYGGYGHFAYFNTTIKIDKIYRVDVAYKITNDDKPWYQFFLPDEEHQIQ